MHSLVFSRTTIIRSGDWNSIPGLLQSPRGRVGDSFSYFLRERTYCQANFQNESVLSWQILEPQINKIFGDATFSDLKIPLAVSVIDLKQGKNILVPRRQTT